MELQVYSASTSKESRVTDTGINCCMCSMRINKSDLAQHIKTTNLTDTGMYTNSFKTW